MMYAIRSIYLYPLNNREPLTYVRITLEYRMLDVRCSNLNLDLITLVLAGGYICRIPNPLFLYIVMLTEERPCLKYNTLKIQTD